MFTNCKNCGAPLRSYECEYCGTRYMDYPRVVQIESTLTNEEFAQILREVETLDPISNIRRL